MPSRFDLFVSKLGLEKPAKPPRISVNRNDRPSLLAEPVRLPKPDHGRVESSREQRRRTN